MSKSYENKLQMLQTYAKAITHICYRNGYIENLHADPSKNLYNSDMKLLNKDIYNRVYTFLLLQFFGNKDEFDKLISHSVSRYGYNWDDPEIEPSLLINKDIYYELKEIEDILRSDTIF